MSDQNSIDGRVFVITGGARGMGAEMARRLVVRGARVVVGDLRADEGARLAEEIGSACTYVTHDVTDPEGWNGIGEAVDALGRFDGIVNNAGIFDPRIIDETDVEFFNKTVAVNQLGTFLGIRFAAERAGARQLSVVNMSSVSGLRGNGGIAYVGAKWAVRGMTKMAAKELGPKGVRVNSVHPGLIDTSMMEAIPADRLEERTATIPLGRRGQPEDVVDVVIFLLSDGSRYMTGAELTVDGGLTV
ncbi:MULTISPECIES: SDR family NAD(P)-dependent oxidoreductase [Roseovarius]|uniref:SDR family NAD(P)-dependent oxidoreductase n=1 Tax=Roseovarius TaxID=74030 RepID=UPI00273DF38A|nr:MULTISPECIES: SDR family oxidoreductase [unclassified Roseovarius]